MGKSNIPQYSRIGSSYLTTNKCGWISFFRRACLVGRLLFRTLNLLKSPKYKQPRGALSTCFWRCLSVFPKSLTKIWALWYSVWTRRVFLVSSLKNDERIQLHVEFSLKNNNLRFRRWLSWNWRFIFEYFFITSIFE